MSTHWFKAVSIEDVPLNGSRAILYNGAQIAVFNFSSQGKWYATQNECPHKLQMLLGRGMLGDTAGEPKVACPLHKKTFSLESGDCLSGDEYKIQIFETKIEDGFLFIKVPVDSREIAGSRKQGVC